MDHSIEPIIDFLKEHFSLEEINDLCLRLGANHEDIPGSTHSVKARELVLWAKRRGKLDDLRAALRAERPGPYEQARLRLEPAALDGPPVEPPSVWARMGRRPRVYVVPAFMVLAALVILAPRLAGMMEGMRGVQGGPDPAALLTPSATRSGTQAALPASGSTPAPSPTPRSTPPPSPTPGSTPAPSPTPGPTTAFTPTARPCPQGLICYQTDFHSLDTRLWSTPSSTGYRLEGGQMIVAREKDASLELHPQEAIALNLRFVELKLAIAEAGGKPGQAFAGIGASLDQNRYLEFLLSSDAQLVIDHGQGGQPAQVDLKVPVAGTALTHTLRLEYTGAEVIFLLDNQEIGYRLASNGYGDWFYFVVKAWPDASLVAALDSVKWATGSAFVPSVSPTAAATSRASVATASSSPACDAAAPFQEGWTLIGQGVQNCTSALASMARAIECAPDNPEVWYGRGNVRFQCGDYPGAVSDLGQAIAGKPDKGLYYEQRGLAYMRIGGQAGYQACVRDFDRVLELLPNNDAARKNRDLCQAALK